MKHFTAGNYEDCYFELGCYMDKSLAIRVMSESEGHIATLTKNMTLPVQDRANAFVDTNNCPWAPELIKKLGIGKFTGWTSPAGFCEYPLYQFNREALSAYSL